MHSRQHSVHADLGIAAIDHGPNRGDDRTVCLLAEADVVDLVRIPLAAAPMEQGFDHCRPRELQRIPPGRRQLGLEIDPLPLASTLLDGHDATVTGVDGREHAPAEALVLPPPPEVVRQRHPDLEHQEGHRDDVDQPKFPSGCLRLPHPWTGV